MKKVEVFVADLTKSRKSTAKIKKRPSVLLMRMTSIYFVIMKVNAGKTTDTKCHLSAKKNQEDSWYCCRCCCQCEKKDWPFTCKDITFAYGGIQWDKAQNSLRKPRGWSRNGSFTGTKFCSQQPTSCWCGWPQQDPAASAPPLFAGSVSWGLLLLLGCKGGVGWRCLDSGELQEDLGRGRPKHQHWAVRHCLQAIVGLLQQVHLAQHWINQEIFRNKHPANYNHSLFIDVFQFDFECTM